MLITKISQVHLRRSFTNVIVNLLLHLVLVSQNCPLIVLKLLL